MRVPKYAYVALAENGDVLGTDTNKAELRDEVSRFRHLGAITILQYSNPRVVEKRKHEKKRA
jgi:hypothetical protein